MVRLLNVMCGNNNNSSRASKHLVMTLQISTCTQLGVLDGRRLDNEADIVTAELSTPARLQNKDLPSLTTAKHSERNDHFAVCFFFFFPHSGFTVDGLTRWLNYLKSHWNQLCMRMTQRHFLIALIVDFLCTQKYVSMLSCERKKQEQKFNDKEVPAWCFGTCQIILFSTKIGRLRDTMQESFKMIETVVFTEYICILYLFFFKLCSDQL